jgi:DNA translocase FtsK/SpoIIIE-like protein
MTTLGLILLALLVLGWPTYSWLKERGRRIAAEALLTPDARQALRLPGAPAGTAPLWLEHEAPRAAQQPHEELLGGPEAASIWLELEQEAMGLPPLDADRSAPAPGEDPAYVVGIEPILAHTVAANPDDPLAFSFGWEVTRQHELTGATVVASLNPRSGAFVRHLANGGASGSGKDYAAFTLMMQLARRNSPERLQWLFIDGKQGDGALLANRAHNWAEPVIALPTVPFALAALRLERMRREQQRVAHRVTNWEELPEAVRPPLLFVYISELDVLETAVKVYGDLIERLGGMATKETLDDWLSTELTTARASGIIYGVGTTDFANRKTRWRKAFGCFICGYVERAGDVEPNMGMPIEELRQLGGTPPHELPGPSFFTVRLRRDVASVRVPLLDLAERHRAIDRLPERPIAWRLSQDPIVQLMERATLPASHQGPDAPRSSVPRYGTQPLPPLPAAVEAPGSIAELLPRWEAQIRLWATEQDPQTGRVRSRSWMVKQMGVRAQDGFDLIAMVLGPSERSSAMTETAVSA